MRTDRKFFYKEQNIHSNTNHREKKWNAGSQGLKGGGGAKAISAGFQVSILQNGQGCVDGLHNTLPRWISRGWALPLKVVKMVTLIFCVFSHS